MHIKTFYSHIMCVSSLWNPCNPGNVPFVICKPSKNETNYVRSIVAETLHLWNSWICLAMMLGKKSKKFSQRWIPWYNPKQKSPTTNESPWTDFLCLCNKNDPAQKGRCQDVKNKRSISSPQLFKNTKEHWANLEVMTYKACRIYQNTVGSNGKPKEHQRVSVCFKPSGATNISLEHRIYE